MQVYVYQKIFKVFEAFKAFAAFIGNVVTIILIVMFDKKKTKLYTHTLTQHQKQLISY